MNWDVMPREAVALQEKLRHKIDTSEYKGEIKYIAGADISLNRFSDVAYAGIIVLSYPALQPVAHACITSKITFPYIPGLLSFREIPALIQAWEKLKREHPDMLP